jgi:hypothetical protein
MYNTEKVDGITLAMEKHGAFWAFSNKQLDEQKKEGVEYVGLNGGLVAPKESVVQLMKDIAKVGRERAQNDLDANTKKEIIHRELANYETFITGDITDTVNALASHGITREDVQAEYPEYYNEAIEYNS